MQRTYLHEDLQQIQHYFPGARPVALHTPFDLTVGPVDRAQLLRDTTSDGELHPDWQGGLLWSR
jgi:hypothetical protein